MSSHHRPVTAFDPAGRSLETEWELLKKMRDQGLREFRDRVSGLRQRVDGVPSFRRDNLISISHLLGVRRVDLDPILRRQREHARRTTFVRVEKWQIGRGRNDHRRYVLNRRRLKPSSGA